MYMMDFELFSVLDIKFLNFPDVQKKIKTNIHLFPLPSGAVM